MSWMSKAFGGGGNYTNPADAAMPYMEQIPGQIDKYYNPYITTGLDAGNIAQSQYAKMASNPSDFTNELMKDYESSDWEKYQQDQMTKQSQSASAQGGFTGTDQDIQNQDEIVQGLSSKDQQQYFNNIMSVLGGGLSGEQSMYNTGFGASNQAADANISNLNAEGGLAYKGQENENAYNASQSNAFMNALMQGAGGAAYYAMQPWNTGGSGNSSSAMSMIPAIAPLLI